MTRLASFLTIALVAFATSFSSAQTYMDVMGTDIDFTNIIETSGGGVFGQPTASGNEINFPATGFSVLGENGMSDFLQGSLELDASSNSGMTFSSVSLQEFGSYFMSGDSTGSVDAFLSVITPDGLFQDSFTFDFTEGAGSWLGNAEVSFPATSTATVFLQNILFADSAPNEAASITKRDVRIRFGDETAIPEPTAVGLLALGLVSICSRRRR